MNSDERPDDAIRGVESNRSEPNADNGDPMNEQIPADTTERAAATQTSATQTSAVTRDAARLRSVMSDIRREIAPAAMAPATQQGAALSPATAYLDTVMPAPRPQATELRSPATRVHPANVDQSDVDDRSRATRLRSVACLVATRQESERRRATPRSTPLPMPAAMPQSDAPAAMAANVRHLDIPIYEPEHDGPTYREGSGGSRVKVLMVLAGTLFTGLVIGVGLYAGGADLVSDLLGSKSSVETVDPNPAAITERPIAELAVPGAFDSLAPSESAAGGTDAAAVGTTDNGSTAGIPRSAEVRAVTESTIAPTPAAARVEKPRTRPVAASVVTSTPKPKPAAEPAVPRTVPTREQRAVEADDDAPAAGVAKSATAAPAKSYTVQVRATPDEAEARKIARRLRGKGAREVEVVRSDKNGSPLYRVRFKSYGTAGDAQAAAGRVGFSDAWILKD